MSDRLPVHFLTPGTAGQTIITNDAGVVAWGAAGSGGSGGPSGEFGGAVLSKSAVQNIPAANTEVTVTFDDEVFDTDNFHNTVTNTTRLTAPTDGPYLVGGSVELNGLPVGAWAILRIRRNGVHQSGDGRARLGYSAGGLPALAYTRPIDMVAGDYVELTVSVSAVVANTEIRDSAGGTSFWITRLAANLAGAGDVDGGTWDSTYSDFIDGGTL